MSSRRSDILPYSVEKRVHPWRATLLVNVPTLILILVMFPLGRVLEDNIDPYFLRIGILIGFNVILAVSLQLINGFSGQFSLGHAGFMAVGAYSSVFMTVYFSESAEQWLTTIVGATVAQALVFLAVIIFGGLVAALAGLAVGPHGRRGVHCARAQSARARRGR